MERKQSNNSILSGILPGLFEDYKTLSSMMNTSRMRRSSRITGEVKARRKAKKIKNIKRNRYVERRKSWRRTRKAAA